MVETLWVCHIIHQTAAVCSPVEGRTQRLEPLLTGGIPDLEDYHAVFKLNLLVGEISANGWLECIHEFIMLKHLNKTSLADKRISNYNYFDEVFTDPGGCTAWSELIGRYECRVITCLHSLLFYPLYLLTVLTQ